MINPKPLNCYDFGPFRLNVTERLLERNQELVPLSPKVIDTLAVLVERRGHVVEKNELMQLIWPDTFVEESSLTQNISILRRVLASGGGECQYIETIPKRGYRFVAEIQEVNLASSELVVKESHRTEILIEEEQLVQEPDTSLTTADRVAVIEAPIQRSISKKATIAIAAALIVTIAGVTGYYFFIRNRANRLTLNAKSIAVLPFKSIGSTEPNDLMGFGVAEATIQKLTPLAQPNVLPMSSVFKFKDPNRDALSTAKELGVDGVLDGTVQVVGDRVQVAARLIRASDGVAIWSASFDEPNVNLFALQDSISARLVSGVLPVVRNSNRESAVNRLSSDPEAYQAYLMGLYFWNLRTKENLSKAISYLETATRKDPNFALAYAYLADSYYLACQDYYRLLTINESLRLADATATKALELDNSIAEAHLVKAGIYGADRNLIEAERHYHRALELKPSLAIAHLRYGYFLMARSQLHEGLAEMRLAQQLDPVSPVTNGALASMLHIARDYDTAIKFNQRTLELLPGWEVPTINLGLNYMEKRMFKEALEQFEKVEKTDHLLATMSKIRLYGLSDRPEEAKRLFLELSRSKEFETIRSLDLAVLYASIGDREKAFEVLEMVRIGPGGIARLKYEPDFDLLRSDPRFAKLVDGQKSVPVTQP